MDHIPHTLADIRRLYSQLYLLFKKFKTCDSTTNNFNPFNLVVRDENSLSALYAFYLQHRKAGELVFLKSFLDLLKGELKTVNEKLSLILEEQLKNLERATIKPEFNIPEGRPDLLIKLNNFSIAVENKLFADFQENQLKRYFNYLEKEGTPFILVLLCPHGEHTRYVNHRELEGLPPEKLLILHHDDFILRWLNCCYQSIDDFRIKFYINDTKQAIINLLNSGENAMENIIDMMKEFILIEIRNKNQFAIEAISLMTVAIQRAAKEVMREKINQLNVLVKEKIRNLFYDYIVMGNLLDERYSQIEIYKDKWKLGDKRYLKILVETQSDWAFPLKIGLAKDELVYDIPDWLNKCIFALTSELKLLKLPNKADSMWWYCYTYVDSTNNSVSTLNQIELPGTHIYLYNLYETTTLEDISNSIIEILNFIKGQIENNSKDGALHYE